MISKLTGTLDSVSGDFAEISFGNGLTYELFLAPYTGNRLGASVGNQVTLFTHYYLEGSSQGNHFLPRLAGFLTESDREFYRLLTTVKGIGPRKALRSMALSSAQIAAAIDQRDTKTIQSLPEIGRRMSETMIATLHGKVDEFLGDASADDRRVTEGDRTVPTLSVAREALEVLVQLGENRAAAIQWIDQVIAKQPDMENATEIVQEALRCKG